MNIILQQIGTIKTPFNELENMPVQPRGAKDTIATIEFKDEFSEGLKDLDGFSHVYLIYYFHKVTEHKLSVIPFNDLNNKKRGVFSTRTPVHPNQIGLSVVELINIQNNIVTIKGVDILDKTPLLDIKPYIENFDKIDGITKSGWMKSSSHEVSKKRSDSRFVDNT
jgi:tRNA-Thr(GGU) m(6)t(6)A37 methyltransferase TsaA